MFGKLTHVCLVIAYSLVSFTAEAQPPCDFKGVSVGDTMSADEIMKAFGVKTFKSNPTIDVFKDSKELVEKYGFIEASTINDFQIGPYCNDRACIIPLGISIGNRDTPVYVFIGVKEKLITSIEVFFNTSYWDDVKQIVALKYGTNSSSELIPITITEYSTKKSLGLDAENITFNEFGLNKSTNDRCKISLTQYDSVFTHHDPLGVYHSVFGIELISKNF